MGKTEFKKSHILHCRMLQNDQINRDLTKRQELSSISNYYGDNSNTNTINKNDLRYHNYRYYYK